MYTIIIPKPKIRKKWAPVEKKLGKKRYTRKVKHKKVDY